jgi:hypothetical protein
MHVANEELLEAVFAVRSTPKLYENNRFKYYEEHRHKQS